MLVVQCATGSDRRRHAVTVPSPSPSLAPRPRRRAARLGARLPLTGSCRATPSPSDSACGQDGRIVQSFPRPAVAAARAHGLLRMTLTILWGASALYFQENPAIKLRMQLIHLPEQGMGIFHLPSLQLKVPGQLKLPEPELLHLLPTPRCLL